MLNCIFQVFYSLVDTALLLTWLMIHVKIIFKKLQMHIFSDFACHAVVWQM